MPHPDVMEKLVSLCKRRGYIFQSSEIYGGTGSVWDYGPLGVELKKNVKDRWWKAMVRMRDDVEGLDAAILMHPRVWEASGHVAGFVDPLVDCRTCKGRFRADKLEDARCPMKPSKRPGEAEPCDLTEPRQFNLMFKTFMGPVEESANVVYLRPETAQGIFVNFLNVQQSTRQKVPFGIAQIGKAFRNEITPGNFIFRTREFEQMEMQFFVEPGTDMEWFEFWKAERMAWHRDLGSGGRPAGLPPARRERAGALRARRLRRRVRLRRHARLPGDRGRAQPRRLRSLAAPAVLRQEARVLRPAEQPALRALRGGDVGRRRPRDAGGAGERVSRGGGGRRERGSRGARACCRRSRRSRPASSRW